MAGALTVDPRGLLERIFLDVAARIDGQRLVAAAAERDPAFAGASHVLAVGKVAIPMCAGLRSASSARRPTLLVAPAPLVARADAPTGVQVVPADHPHPTARSVAAAQAALRFVVAAGGDGAGSSEPGARLLVLLSGGASALLCAPADGLAWQDKRDAVAAVARAGATIRELNVIRKHLSAIKGGRLARAARVPIAVRALSDVIGDDPGTIGSGPFSPDSSTFADAAAIVARLGVALPPAAAAHLARGSAGAIADTPKPGDHELDHVDYRVLAGPARVVAEARAAVVAAGCAGDELAFDVEDTVDACARAVAVRLRRAIAAAVAAPDRPRVLIGNGEPRVILPADAAPPPPATDDADSAPPPPTTRRGGRATHLALLVARELAALPDELRARVAFLAAGTDDRDGDTDVSGATVDGTTWARARSLGLDPEAALRGFDSLPVLAAVGDTVRGPGTSNLLDLHLLVIA